MFASRGNNWCAVDAVKVARGFSSSQPVHVAAQGDSQFDLFVPASATIDIHVSAGAKSALVDGATVALKNEHLIVSLSHGEHRVRILAGSAL
jgi:hypothetical protein